MAGIKVRAGKTTHVANSGIKRTWLSHHEIPRKTMHGSIGLITIALYAHGASLDQVTPVLIKMLAFISLCELLRFRSLSFNRAYISVVGPLMREREKQRRAVNGVIWYLVGLIVVFSIFPKDLGLISVLTLSWADLAASTVGRAWGRHTPKLVGDKSLAGTLAAFAAGALCALLVYGDLLPRYSEYNSSADISWHSKSSYLGLSSVALVTGLIAALGELFPIIDDNMSIPIATGAGLWLVLKLAAIPSA